MLWGAFHLVTVALATTTAQLELRVVPDTTLVGEGASVRLVVLGPSVAPGDLALDVELGHAGPLERGADGELSAAWGLPAELTPRRLTAAVLNRRTHEVAFVTVALLRRALFHVKTNPDAAVVATVRGEVAGEGKADMSGTLDIRIAVPPAAETATLIELGDGAQVREERSQPLGLHDELRLWGVVEPGETPVAHLVLYRDSGESTSGARVSVRWGEREMDAREEGAGVFVADFAHARGVQSAGDTLVAEARLGAEQAHWAASLAPMAAVPRLWWAALGLGAWGDPDGMAAVASRVSVGRRLQAFSGRLSPVVELGFGFPWSAPSAQTGAVIRRLGWFAPVTAGAAYGIDLGSEWQLDMGVHTGALLAGVEKSKTAKNHNAKDKLSETVAAAWIVQAALEVERAVGPGAVSLGARVWHAPAGLRSVSGQSWAAGLFVGYAVDQAAVTSAPRATSN